MKKILKPFSLAYKTGMEIRESLYNQKLLKKHYSKKVKVISVGNLTMGGTGKTPVMKFLIQLLIEQGHKVAVVSRNYKAQLQGTEKIKIEHPHGGSFYGDEAFMLQKTFPDIPVYVGPEKFKTVKMVEQNETVDFILVDDGFQHIKLHRDFDIVVLDATEDIKHYKHFPLGRAREGFNSLKRAHCVFVTKWNWGSEKNKKFLAHQIEKYFPHKNRLFHFDIDLLDFKPIHKGKSHSTTDVFQLISGLKNRNQHKVIGFCGIARPRLFFEMLEKKMQIKLRDSISFADHFEYTPKDINQMLAKYSDDDIYITTEKDIDKVKIFWPSDYSLWTAPLGIKCLESRQELYEKIRQCML